MAFRHWRISGGQRSIYIGVWRLDIGTSGGQRSQTLATHHWHMTRPPGPPYFPLLTVALEVNRWTFWFAFCRSICWLCSFDLQIDLLTQQFWFEINLADYAFSNRFCQADHFYFWHKCHSIEVRPLQCNRVLLWSGNSLGSLHFAWKIPDDVPTGELSERNQECLRHQA